MTGQCRASKSLPTVSLNRRGAFLATPSPSHKALGEKLRVLEQEYGINAQPRHLAALYADARAIG